MTLTFAVCVTGLSVKPVPGPSRTLDLAESVNIDRLPGYSCWGKEMLQTHGIGSNVQYGDKRDYIVDG